MSRYYNMSVTITGANPDRIEEVKAAAGHEWPFDDWYERNGVLSASFDDYLFSGETEEEFVQRLAKAIWTANGTACEVEVTATYLENLPRESYSLGADDYDRLMKPAEEAIDDGK